MGIASVTFSGVEQLYGDMPAVRCRMCPSIRPKQYDGTPVRVPESAAAFLQHFSVICPLLSSELRLRQKPAICHPLLCKTNGDSGGLPLPG